MSTVKHSNVAYTIDFKRRAVARLANGARVCDVSRAAGVPASTILRWRRELREQRTRAVEAARSIAEIAAWMNVQ